MHLVDDDDPYTDENFTIAHMQRYVDTAARRGVAEIGFTDHVYRFTVARDWLDEPLLARTTASTTSAATHAAVQAAQDAGLPVKVGLEVDYLAGQDEQIAGVVNGCDWDYVLGSVHWIDGYAVDWDAKSIWDQMTGGRGLAPIRRRAVRRGGDRPLRLDGAPRHGQGVRLAARPAAARAVRADRRRLPGGRRVRRGVDGRAADAAGGGLSGAGAAAAPARAGVPVTLASDAHEPGEVGRDFDRSVAALHDAGYRTITVFQRARPAAGASR